MSIRAQRLGTSTEVAMTLTHADSRSKPPSCICRTLSVCLYRHLRLFFTLYLPFAPALRYDTQTLKADGYWHVGSICTDLPRTFSLHGLDFNICHHFFELYPEDFPFSSPSNLHLHLMLTMVDDLLLSVLLS